MAVEDGNAQQEPAPSEQRPGMNEEVDLLEISDSRTFLIFRDGSCLYALDALCVQMLAEAQRPVWVPSSNKQLLGVVHLHGQFIPLFNLPRVLGFEAEQIQGPGEMLESRLIVLEIDGRRLAFNARTVLELVEVSESAIQPMSGGLTGPSPRADRGLLAGYFEEAAGVVTVIDARKLLSALKAGEAA